VDAGGETGLFDAVSDMEANGRKPLPVKDFPPPSRELTGR
jgi:hypothetical protein